MPDDSLVRPELSPFRRHPPRTIGAFEVRAPSNELAGPGGVIRLRPRLMDVLLRLAAAPGEVVPRQVLLDDVWPRRLVADEVLSRTIAELRIALADDAREARYIETLPKVGYRLIAPVVAPAPVAIRPPAAGPVPPAAGEALDATPSFPASDAGDPRATPAPAGAVPVYRPYRLPLLLLLGGAAVVGATLMLRPDPPPASPAVTVQQQLNSANSFSSELAMETGPRFAPDGSRVAFALGDSEHAQIVVQDVATRTRVILGDPGSLRMSPVFFPDGKRLAYYRRQGSACAIVEREIASDLEKVILDCSQHPGARFDLAPDGTRLVFASVNDGDTGLRLLDLATGRISPLTAPDRNAGNDVYPRFSPDGKRVAFMRGLLGFREVWTVALADPEHAGPIGSPRGLAWGLAWMSSDGPLLVSADWPGSRMLNLVDLRTGASTIAGARGAQFPDVSVRGDVVYEAAAYQANLQRIDLADLAQPPQTLWPSAKYTNYPQFSPDGTQLVFMSNRDNTASLFVGSPGGEAHRLPLPVEFMYYQAHWSHDARALYAVQWRQGTSPTTTRGARIDVASGATERLDALGDGVTDVRDTPDGRTLYYAVQDGPLMQVWRASVDAPEKRERLPLPKVLDYDMRGDRLVYAESQRSDLTVCELPDLRCEAVGLPPREGRTGFALAKGAVWVGYYGEPGELVRFDLAQHAITLRVPHGPSAVGLNLAVSADERAAVIAHQEPPAIDLMLAPRPR